MSLQRKLEPEVMDSWEEALGYDAMDHREVNQRFADDFLATGVQSGEILDLGTGTAQIPIVICKQAAKLQIVAGDMALSMLDIARRNVEIASLQNNIFPDHIDAKQLTYADGRFDAVISNSIIHHLENPILAIQEAVRVCRPGGRIFFRDLLRPASLEALSHLVQTYSGQEESLAQEMFSRSLEAALTLQEIQDLIASLGFSPADVKVTSDRHWTWSSVK